MLSPGTVQFLPYGTEIQQAGNNRPGETYFPYVKTSTKKISAGVGMSYSALSNDHTDSSYSAERSAALEERLGYKAQQEFLKVKACRPVSAWFFEAEAYAGRLGDYLRNPAEYRRSIAWQAGGWTWVDPKNDAVAAEKELAMGVTTRRHIAAQKGLDWDEIILQLAREKESLEDLGLDVSAGEAAPPETPEPDAEDPETEKEEENGTEETENTAA